MPWVYCFLCVVLVGVIPCCREWMGGGREGPPEALRGAKRRNGCCGQSSQSSQWFSILISLLPLLAL